MLSKTSKSAGRLMPGNWTNLSLKQKDVDVDDVDDVEPTPPSMLQACSHLRRHTFPSTREGADAFQHIAKAQTD